MGSYTGQGDVCNRVSGWCWARWLIGDGDGGGCN